MTDIQAKTTTLETSEDDIEKSWELAEMSSGLVNSTDGSCIIYNAIQWARKDERKRFGFADDVHS